MGSYTHPTRRGWGWRRILTALARQWRVMGKARMSRITSLRTAKSLHPNHCDEECREKDYSRQTEVIKLRANPLGCSRGPSARSSACVSHTVKNSADQKCYANEYSKEFLHLPHVSLHFELFNGFVFIFRPESRRTRWASVRPPRRSDAFAVKRFALGSNVLGDHKANRKTAAASAHGLSLIRLPLCCGGLA